TTATLSISVSPMRKHGDAALHFVATSADRRASGDVTHAVLVRGAPGTLDTSFGDGGIVRLGEGAAEATGIAIQADAKILLGGRFGSDAAVVRLLPDGRLDETFGTGGKARLPIEGVVSTNDV